MLRFLKPVFIMALAAATISCGNRALSDKPGAAADTVGEKLLPLPAIPESFVSSDERAGYLLRHFWDSLDFGVDTAYSRNRNFMEQNFANYISIFHVSDRDVVLSAVRRLLFEAHKDSTAYVLLIDIAEKYLYDPQSPMVNEDVYRDFLVAQTDEESPFQSDEHRQKIASQMAAIARNHVGTAAENFDYINAVGRRSTLYKTLVPGYMLLVFFDPECEECRQCVDMLEDDVVMKSMLLKHKMTVLAIDVNGSQLAWEGVKHSYPKSWIIGLDASGVSGKGIYAMRNMPSLYLLDHEKIVVLKDVSVENLFSFLCDESGLEL
jgi:hypothetical protein